MVNSIETEQALDVYLPIAGSQRPITENSELIGMMKDHEIVTVQPP
jgi:hypothetical protein